MSIPLLYIMSKQQIIEAFTLLIAKVHALEEKGAVFKAREYADIIQAFQSWPEGERITKEKAKETLLRYGKKNPTKALQKIGEIVDTGTLKVVEDAKQNPQVQAVLHLSQVYGIGTKKAIELYQKYNITTVAQLETLVQQHSKCINSKQKIGLTYFHDLQSRIPRTEIAHYEARFQDLIHTVPQLKYYRIRLSINGSYRRRAPSSGDIDVLITCENGLPAEARQTFIAVLREQQILVDILANGKKKFMGVCLLGGKSTTHRHVDIIDTTPEEFPFAQLYFTGSKLFNTRMRAHALSLGFSLNEFRFSHKSTKIPLTSDEIYQILGKPHFESEQDIFTFLKVPYVEPWERDR